MRIDKQTVYRTDKGRELCKLDSEKTLYISVATISVSETHELLLALADLVTTNVHFNLTDIGTADHLEDVFHDISVNLRQLREEQQAGA